MDSLKPTTDAPDFICVGMPKAGTDWLLDQLQYHPDFWMPPLKGIHYLDRRAPRLKHAERRLRQLRKRPGYTRSDRRGFDERDLQFLTEATALGGQRRNLDAYGSLFRFKNGRLSGEITATYYNIQEETMREIAQRFPN